MCLPEYQSIVGLVMDVIDLLPTQDLVRDRELLAGTRSSDFVCPDFP